MNDTTPIIILVIAINSVLFLLMMSGVYLYHKRTFPFGRVTTGKLNSQLEQRLVMEAISACALEPNSTDIIRAIGTNAAEKTGQPNWIIWLRKERNDFYIVDAQLPSISLDEIKDCSAPDFYAWVLQNLEPLELGPFIQNMTDNKYLKTAMGNMNNGLLIPFLDGQFLLGFIILGGGKDDLEKRSSDFLSLFGAFAAIIFKKSMADERQSHLMKEQLRADSLANLGKLAAGMAHEIRNPLTFMKAAVQQLQRRYEFADRDKLLTVGIVEEIDRINHHVEDLLVLGKIDPVEFQDVSFNEILKKAVNFTLSQANEKRIKLQLTIPDEDLLVSGNEDMLWQIILNLILNGIEAIGENGELRVSCCRTEGFACSEITDSGPGIPTDIADKIFDPFFTTKDHGTGLGLSTSYSVAKAHGGSIALVQSSSSGSTFKVMIPTI